MVVGGTVADWGTLTDDEWRSRVRELGEVVAATGGRWLTLRPFERGQVPAAHPVLQSVTPVQSCTVVVDPSPEGRERLVVALRKVADDGKLDEGSIATALFAPAEVEPDLVVVLGPRDRLPPSLVWELAYSELVYVDVEWSAFQPRHLEESIDAFESRHRRFGGLD
jgi:undecaprenyl diphosphate synthase